jgi:PAS domain-containing protein
MVSVVDINDLKRAEEALRASEQRFRTFVDHATDAFFLQSYGGVILDVNRQACESLVQCDRNS